MPPKTKNFEETASNQLESILEQLKAVNDRLAEQDTKFSKLLADVTKENAELKKQNEKQQETIDTLQEKVNALEQRNRASSIRVFNLPLSGDTTNNDNVADQLFGKLLKPILKGALDRGRLNSFPTRDEVIEVAHILPSKSNTSSILCRLKKPLYHQLILQHKKDFAPRAPGKDDRPGQLLYPIYEDATRDTFLLMKKLAADSRVLASWISGGSIRFRLHSNPDTINRVRLIYAPFESHFPG